jgi:hypothetical protein
MVVHIILNGRAACGFTSDRPERWDNQHKWVYPEEAHYANCWDCIGRLNTLDELEAKSAMTDRDVPWPQRPHRF